MSMTKERAGSRAEEEALASGDNGKRKRRGNGKRQEKREEKKAKMKMKYKGVILTKCRQNTVRKIIQQLLM